MEFGPEALVFDRFGNPTYAPLPDEPIDEEGRPVRGFQERQTIDYTWFGEVILRCSPEFVNEDNGTLIDALLDEQRRAAEWGGVSSPVVLLWDPSYYLKETL